MAERISGVYAIRNMTNGKVYVGRSVDCKGRWGHHRAQLRKGKHANPHLQAAWSRYGEGAFVLGILEREADRSRLPALERKWIEYLQSGDRERGYNLDTVREGRWVMSEETKAKIGAANRGKIRSPAMKKRMREVKQGQGKGRVKSPGERANLSRAHARRAAGPDGYAWFRSPEGREVQRENGKKGAAARWNKTGKEGD